MTEQMPALLIQLFYLKRMHYLQLGLITQKMDQDNSSCFSCALPDSINYRLQLMMVGKDIQQSTIIIKVVQQPFGGCKDRHHYVTLKGGFQCSCWALCLARSANAIKKDKSSDADLKTLGIFAVSSNPDALCDDDEATY